ncbi:hypothetical protein ABIE51_001404 [Lysobacter sp. OAE881]|uniref:hypothetical protein n=1 Tax=Lysobacter sp. OAE881 TaxID=2663813 RepID=UPI00178B9786
MNTYRLWALADRWRDDAKGFREQGMIDAAEDAEHYAEELEALLPYDGLDDAELGRYVRLTAEQQKNGLSEHAFVRLIKQAIQRRSDAPPAQTGSAYPAIAAQRKEGE